MGSLLIADAAKPDKIDDLKRAGVSAVPTVKDVSAGSTMVKGCVMHVVDPSANLVLELGSYDWKTARAGNRIDELVKANDHILDAVRYAAYEARSWCVRLLLVFVLRADRSHPGAEQVQADKTFRTRL